LVTNGRKFGHIPGERRAESQERASIALGRAALARGEGRHEEALGWIEEAWSLRGSVGPDHPNFKAAIAGGLESAVALDDGECPAGCSDSLELLQPVEMASTANAPAVIRVVRFHIVIIPFCLFIP